MKQRNLNFDILRSISMLLIVVWHFYIHGSAASFVWNINSTTSVGFDVCNNAISCVNYLISQFLCSLSSVGVDCFVLITGYFLITSEKFRWEGFLKTWVEMFFYNIVFIGIDVFLGSDLSAIEQLKKCIFPIYYNTYWFVNNYLALLLIAPFLSICVNHICKLQYQFLLIILLILNFSFCDYFYGDKFSNPYSLLLFVFLYLIGGYIRIYNPIGKFKNYWGLICLGICASTVIACVVFNIRNHISPFRLSAAFVKNNSLALVMSISLFLFMKSLQIKSNRSFEILIKIAPYTFGVYLIHDNPFVRNFLWKEFICPYKYVNTYIYIPMAIIIPIIIFIICIILDIGRDHLFKLFHLNKFINKMANNMSSKFKQF